MYHNSTGEARRNSGLVRRRQQAFKDVTEGNSAYHYSSNQEKSVSPSQVTLQRARRKTTGNVNSFVWIRVDVVEAIRNNHGTLPAEWKAKNSKKRARNQGGGDGLSWDWIRAVVVQSTASSTSFNRHRTKNDSQSVLATFAVQDNEFAPSHLKNATVSLSYEPHEMIDPIVCNANSWWNSRECTPPDDLTSLTHLHEPAVVYCLMERYRSDTIYTYTGKILLALNPFRSLPGFYGENVMRQYWQLNPSERPAPHVYAIAQDAYRSMIESDSELGKTDQSILVSGESGSGKTVTTKIIMGYLAKQSQRTTSLNNESSKDGIESQILQSNPILESFGNARTVRNDNSSRFGKFMELLFTPTGTLVSASIETYLLEKVRLISQSQGERNYHIFYEVLAGLSQRDRRNLHIGNLSPKDFRMTASGTYDRRDGIDDRETYRQLQKALDTVGFAIEEQLEMFAVVCALLHVSNISFGEVISHGGEEGSAIIQSTSSRSAIDLLGVPMTTLNNALCLCAIEARGEVFHKNLTTSQATKALEALIKATYGALFTHIVQSVNNSIAAKHGSNIQEEERSRIGVLDIFGFESFAVNSFEQLCINYCNEALQQQFNRFVFKLEQEEYDQEGIDWAFISFPDNQDILDLIEKRRVGILSILDDQCRVATCHDASFCRAVHDKCEDHPRFLQSMTQRSSLSFTIFHYAGPVTYNSKSFLEKNKDELPKETTELLKSSSKPFLAYLGSLLGESAGPGATNQRAPSPTSSVSSYSTVRAGASRGSSSMLRESVGSQFSQQLKELRNRIEATTPHYVRCLKPNDDLVPDRFAPHVIADQLRCAGVLEAIRVSRVGFPHRYFHENFKQRYGILTNRQRQRRCFRPPECDDIVQYLIPQVTEVLQSQDGTKSLASIQEIVSLGMQIGHSKVFLRRPVFEALEFLRSKRLGKSAILIQKNARMFIAQLDYYDAYMANIILQSFVRQIISKRIVSDLRAYTAAVRIQCAYRKYIAETSFFAVHLIVHFCQRRWRGARARRISAGILVERHARKIQCAWRRHVSWRKYRALLFAVVVLQCFFRRRKAKRLYKERKLQARNLDNVAAQRDRFKDEALRLRKEVEQLKRSKNSPSQNSNPTEVNGPMLPKDTTNTHSSSLNEVEHLKAEVNRLKEALAQQSKILNIGDNDRPPESVFVRKMSGWSIFGGRKEDAASHTSSLGNGISPQTKVPQQRPNATAKEWNFESPNAKSKGKGKTTTPMSWPSPFTPAMSSSSMSLLDADNCDTGSGKQPISDTDIVIPKSTARQIFMESPTPVVERRGMDFEEQLRWLHTSIIDNDHMRVSEILGSTPEPHVLVNEISENGRAALHIAVCIKCVTTTKLLLESGGFVNAQDNCGDTPLHLADDCQMVALLLQQGRANPNIPNLDGICVLHKAVQRQDVQSVQLLLQHHAKVDIADNFRWLTPIHLAAMPDEMITSVDSQRFTIMKMLCSADGVDLNYEDSEGNTPLHYAVQNKEDCSLIQLLLDKGAKPQVSNSRDQTPLLLMCHNASLRKQNEYQACLHSFLFHGADPNHQSKTGATALHLSLYHKDTDGAIQLVSHSAELNLIWQKPHHWNSFWKDMQSSEILPLDMIVDDHSLHRVVAAITRQPRLAPSRPWCMSCKTGMGPENQVMHCGHCGRHLCRECCQCVLPPNYFPKSFEIYGSTSVCFVCEKVLMARKEDTSSGTHPISSLGDDEEELQ